MKLLDKIMARFGYVPKSKNALLEYEIDKLNALLAKIEENKSYLIDRVFNGYAKAGYYWNRINESDVRFVVYVGCDRHIPHNIVKSYISDDFEYAKLLAEELCEKLNERY